MSMNLRAVLHHASVLQRATTLRELVQLTWEAVRTETRYRTVWLALLEPENPGHLRIVQAEGAMHELVLATCPLVPLAGDAMVAELIAGKAPVLVLEAAEDPRTNKTIVAALKNRTILSIPMVLGPVVIGSLGVGTFGDEGVMAPTDGELELLVVLATQLAGAFTRVQLLEKQEQDTVSRLGLERHLESLQRVELMGVLAAGVAHDLNNCLAVVHSNLGSLDLASLAPDGGEAVEDALHATRKACGVVQQLLALGRANSRQHELIDLNARVTSTLQLVRSSIPAEVTVTHEAGHAPLVDGDPVQIEQALANLLINARDAVGRRGRIVVGVMESELTDEFVRTHHWAKPGRYGHVRVRDTGVGIAPEVLTRIYDPLFTTKSTDTGLGLAVVSRVVQQHGGLLHCESTVGAGTTFDVYLPVRV